jgi:hypothetical protein
MNEIEVPWSPPDASVERAQRSPFWWVYFAYYVLQYAGVPFILATHPPLPMLIFGLLFDLIGVAGLYCFLRSTAFMSRPFWMTYMVVWSCRLLFGAYLFTRALTMFAWNGSRENYVSVIGLAALALALPMLAALWLYTFRSPAIWAAKPAPA